MKIYCTNCGRPYPEIGAPYNCPKCGGVFDISELEFEASRIDNSQPGLWKFRHTFAGIPESYPAASLGEGLTPLLWSECFGRQIAFKCEFQNPTGSFKDRGSSLIASFLKIRNVTAAAEDSSGNAGASFAAYAAHVGIKADIFVPASASGPKRKQIEFFGANVHPVDGTRSEVTSALLSNVESSGMVYASHAFLPVNIPGYATAAYEIYEQLGGQPGAVLVPTGQGGLLLGLLRGFRALKNANLIRSIPYMIGVQARSCSPLWILSTAGMSAEGFIVEGQTLAEGVKVRRPVRTGALLKMVADGLGEFVPVDEVEILRGRDELARRGLYVEPTSAITWSALEQTINRLPDPAVVVLTGSGYKFS